MEASNMGYQNAEFLSADYRRIARDKLRGNWGSALGTSLLYVVIGSAAGGLASGIAAALSTGMMLTGSTALIALASLVTLALSFAGASVTSALMLGHELFYIDLCNNKGANLVTLFSRFSIFMKAFGFVLFMGLFVFLWSLLLFVPGIIAAFRYAMAPYLMAQHPEMGIREAMNESKRLMAGHKWRLFCLSFSFIGWALLCMLTFGIGYLWLAPYMQTSFAAFYLDRTGQGIPLNVN